MSWLERHFCMRLSSRIEGLQEENARLKQSLRESKEGTEELNGKLQRCIEKRKELRAEIKKLEKSVEWFEDRMKTMDKALEDAMVIPDLDVDESELSVYRFDDDVFAGYDLRIGDLEYYLLPYAKWIEVLTPIQKEIAEALIRWQVNISDCENWASVMASTVMVTFRKTGLKKQGAFMIIWDMIGSQKHAYNAFMDATKTVWIYEPQNNTVVGKLGETTDEYESDWVWFPGAQPA